MKGKTCKALGLLLAVLMVVSLLPAAALAAGDDTIDVYVTISDKGVVTVPMEKVAVKDLDANGTYDVNEALIAAHDAFYLGGAEAGYGVITSDYGPMISKLWGIESTAVTYWNNNAMCWGLSDALAEGDHLNAYVLADQETYSDPYAYLDKFDYTADAGSELEVTLMAASGYDENWNVIFAPCSGAMLRAYEAETFNQLTPDSWSWSEGENGVYKITFKEAGSYLIIADKPEDFLCPTVSAVTASPAGDPAKPIEVYVTISDKGVVTVPMRLVTVEDLDASGAFDVNEVLYAAHEAFYTGGAAAGYAVAESEWGLGITKLWGDESGSFGYYKNNAMCWGLTDPVVAWDTVSAFVYADQTAWSDAYAYFDRFEYTPIAGISFDVKLMAADGFDENWTPVFAPCNGAMITAYYEDTFEKVPSDKWFAFGDDDGVYQITFKEPGKYIIVGDKPEDFLVPAVSTVEAFDHDCPSEKFTDFAPDAWYHGPVDYVVGHGIMNGTSATTFEPATATTRAMIATILWRLDGAPVVNAVNPFDDVVNGAWYTDAIVWAAANGIVDGYGNGKFGPNDDITREQLATMFWRYAKYKGYDVSIGEETNIIAYEDFDQISKWAVPAMQWACGSGLIRGRTVSTLAPGEGANRAEVAAIIMRFMENT